nr:MAG TPA_asm: hypothetical protein [Caudoviricetes sp.]
MLKVYLMVMLQYLIDLTQCRLVYNVMHTV